MAITTTLSTSYMWWSKTPHFPFGLPEVRWLLVARGIGGFFGVFGMYCECECSALKTSLSLHRRVADSLLYLPLADATVITFVTPSLSCYVCAKLIAEPFTRMEQIGALISFVGVVLIARPTTFFTVQPSPPSSSVGDNAGHADPLNQKTVGVADLSQVTASQRLTAILVALVGVVGSAMAFVAMRWIGKRASPLLSVNYFCACVTVVSAVAMLILPDVKFMLPSGTREWAYLIFLGCCGFAMQFLLSAGLQHEKSSRATLMTYTQMLFALFFDKLVFGHNPSLASIFGSLLIVSSAIYIALQKESAKQRAEAEKQRQQQAEASGNNIEMAATRRRSVSRRDEELGLMAHGEDEDEETGGSAAQRGPPPPR